MHTARCERYTFTACNTSAVLKADNKSIVNLHWKEVLIKERAMRILWSIKAAK